MEDKVWGRLFARWVINFILCLSVVLALVCGMGILIALLECAWDVMILCMVLCPLGIGTAVTIDGFK